MLYDNTVVAALVLIVGFVLLIKGADWLIKGAVSISRHIGISELLIGMTVVAFGTSLPELVINLLANNSETAGLAIGNIIGANIANIWLILGICALITPLAVHRKTVWREILFAVGAGFLLLALVMDDFIGLSSFNGLDRIDGLILLTLFGMFIYYIFGKIRLGHRTAATEAGYQALEGRYSRSKSLLFVLVGATALAFGGNFIVGSASSLAETLGIGTETIGLTIVALGTTAPELATSLSAVRKRKTDLAVGGIVGSTIFNTLWILGISSTWRPLPFNSTEIIDASVSAGALGLLFLVLIAARQIQKRKEKEPSVYHVIGTYAGLLFVACYIIYLFYLIARA